VPLSIRRPGKIVCVGLNYLDHAQEGGMELPKAPLLFAKWPNTLIGDGDAIVLPPETTEVDYEAELGVVIGTTAKRVSEADALGHVEGYTCLNDVSSATDNGRAASHSTPSVPLARAWSPGRRSTIRSSSASAASSTARPCRTRRRHR
jgi:2-keto-4-pentenoate hydratase/2-oxohepta-3-ene-1,7-dioic acid hydratase in catechol pathway